MLGAALWLAVPALLTWPANMPSSRAWGAMAVAGALCSALAFMMYFELMQRVDMTLTSSVTYLITVFALVYGVLFLDEHITLWMVLCGAVVMMLVGRLFRIGRLVHNSSFGILACAVGATLIAIQWLGFTETMRGGPGFDGLLMFDPFAAGR